MITRLRRALRAQWVLLIVGFGSLAAIVGARSLLVESQRRDNEAVRETMLFREDLASALSLVQDAETGQRGYLLTGETSYLEPYEIAAATLARQMSALEEASAGDPQRLGRIAEIDALATRKFEEMAESIRRLESGDREGAVALVRSDRGKELMDELRGMVGDLSRETAATLEARLARTQSIERWLRLAAFGAIGAILLLAAYVIWNTRRHFMAVAHAQAALDRSNAALRQEIEHREKAEQQLRQMQKMEAIGQLTGGIAHDFNNMLAVITSAMNIAQRKLARGDADIGALVEAAADAAGRAAGLTARLLAFARQQPLAPQVVDANRMVTGMSDLLRRTLGEAVEIETVLAGGLWKTYADSSQLENSIINLAVNARDAMDGGEGKLTIETANCHLDDAYSAAHSEVPAGQYVLVAVSDTGSGMSPEVLARAFDPFFTTKAVSKGTGLGLSQVFGFVKQSGGHVKIYSEPGEGTTVKIYLPRHFGEDESGRQGAPDASLARAVTETVLVVEDDSRVRATTSEALKELGYTVIAAASGAEALEKLAETPEIALLFTDIVMPGMNGRKLAEAALARRPGLKIVYTTGFTKNAVVHNGVLDPGVNFLAKPFTIAQLAAKLREVLEG